jgi:hypothetical protein
MIVSCVQYDKEFGTTSRLILCTSPHPRVDPLWGLWHHPNTGQTNLIPKSPCSFLVISSPSRFSLWYLRKNSLFFITLSLYGCNYRVSCSLIRKIYGTSIYLEKNCDDNIERSHLLPSPNCALGKSACAAQTRRAYGGIISHLEDRINYIKLLEYSI